MDNQILLEELINNVFEKYKHRLTAKKPLSPQDSVCVLIRAGDIESALSIINLAGAELIKKQNMQGNFIPEVAAWHGEVKLLKQLSLVGADLITQNISVFGARHIRILYFLKSSGNLDVNAKGEHGTTPLQQACNVTSFLGNVDTKEESQRLECITFLLDNGAAINDVNDFGRTAIMGAAYAGAVQIVKLLLEHGACISPEMRCSKGRTAIQWASSREVELLLRSALISSESVIIKH